jgi:predicted AlkP superfamily pyrophosphatase or phosphodiesterase
LRVQSVDKHLRKFIQTLSTRDDTISFIFADHGKTYTSYQVKFLEGRQEMYHPMMLVILPKNLAQKFGNDVAQI